MLIYWRVTSKNLKSWFKYIIVYTIFDLRIDINIELDLPVICWLTFGFVGYIYIIYVFDNSYITGLINQLITGGSHPAWQMSEIIYVK